MGCERISEGHPKIIKSRKLLPPRARGTARGGGVTKALQTGGGTAGACLAGAGAVGEKRPRARGAMGGRGTEILAFLPLPALQPCARPAQGPGGQEIWDRQTPREQGTGGRPGNWPAERTKRWGRCESLEILAASY